MAQSVELLLDPGADHAIRRQWDVLAQAGLPSERRPEPSGSHRPHVTLYAGDRIAPAAEEALPELFTGLDLNLVIGALVIFGPRRDRCVLVRSVAATRGLLRLQQQVAELCRAEPGGQFAAGRWTPHVTLARRVPTEQLGAAVRVLGETSIAARACTARRWDGTARVEWSLTEPPAG